MPSDSRPPELHELKLGESALVYCADFSNDPAVTGGATLSGPTATADNSAIVAVSNPTVIATDFTQYDSAGLAVDSVPANKGVSFLVQAVKKGQTRVRIQVVCSDGQNPIVDVNFKVT